VMASSKMISDQLLEASGQSPNSMFVLNMIDALNGREDVAIMRAKVQRFNPLEPTGTGKKAMIKTFNMAGLPFLVVIFGLIVWWRRHTRRMDIQRRFLIPDMESK
jgi:ABC-2 type transport system permease protein